MKFIFCFFCVLEVFCNSEELLLAPGLIKIDLYEAGSSDECEIPDRASLMNDLDDFLEKPVTQTLIDCIKKKVVEHFQQEGYPVVAVTARSGQKISSGQLILEIQVGKIGTICGSGACFFDNGWLASESGLNEGERITSTGLSSALSWINQNPFRDSRIILEPSTDSGFTNVIIETKDRNPVRFFAGYENTGNIIAGDSRIYSGLNLGNLWNSDHQLNFQFMTAPDLKEWWGVSAVYSMPLPFRHTLKLIGSYVGTQPDISSPGLITATTSDGFRWQSSLRYVIPLPAFTTFSESFIFGYDFKRTNNFASYSPLEFFRNDIDISQFLLSYEAAKRDSWGSTLFGFSFILSPSHMSAYNKTKNFEQVRAGATSFYIYVRGTIDRVTALRKDWSWISSFIGQYSNNRLVPSEEFVLGGALTVRGYDENEIISDRGILFKNEIRTPLYNFSKMRKIPIGLQILAFVDFGYANDVDQDIYNENSAVLASIGPGLRFNAGDYLEASVDYGFQLHHISNTDRPFTSDDHSRVHVSVTAGY